MYQGSGVAIVTPFNQDGSVDYKSLENLLNWHVENKTDAIIITGTTGEVSTLTDEEQLDVIKFTVETINKRIPVIAGTGINDTRHMVYLSQEAEKLGVDALLCVTPYYNKTTQTGLYYHFASVAEAVSIPIILYSVPSRTNMEIEVETLVKLSKFENIIGLKDATGNLEYTKEVIAALPDFYIYSGNDDLIYDVMALGGNGVISVVANVKPYDTHQLVKTYLDGDKEASKAIQEKMNPLIDQLFVEPNPIPCKFIMDKKDMITHGYLRLPLYPLSEKYEKQVLEAFYD